MTNDQIVIYKEIENIFITIFKINKISKNIEDERHEEVTKCQLAESGGNGGAAGESGRDEVCAVVLEKVEFAESYAE